MENLMALQKYVRQLRPIQENYVDHVEQVQDLFEGKVKAEDYEAAIVIGWHKNNKTKFKLSSSGISDKVYKTVTNNPQALDAGEKMAQQIAKHFSNAGAKAEQYGRAKSTLTSFWKSFGASDTTPKTDILIGNKRLSLKIGLAQLMSGGQAESMATFYAALNSTPELKKEPQFQKVNEVFESFVKSTLAPSQLRPIIKKGDNPVVNAAEIAHKNCMKELGLLFEQSAKFKIAFAREAMSGYEKYGSKSNSAAEFMVVATHDGSNVSIHSIDDDAYCEKIANKMKLQARFKTSGRVLTSFKSGSNPKGKTGEYNFWSVVSLIVDAMETKNESLDEGFLDRMKKKVKSIASKVIGGVKNFLTKKVSNLFKFLSAIPSISVSKRINFK
jgi:hypothetical protein